MCCRCPGAAAALLSHLTLLLVLWSGLALAWSALLATLEGGELAAYEALPSFPRAAALLLPLCAAPVTLALAHLAVVGVRARSRAILITYCAVLLIVWCGYAGVATWAGVELTTWLQEPRATELLASHAELRAWLWPLLYFAQPDIINTKDIVPAGVAGVWAAAALWPLLQLAAGVLALCAARRRKDREPRSSLRRTSSVYYEPTAPPPHQQRYQSPQHHAPLDQHAPWY